MTYRLTQRLTNKRTVTGFTLLELLLVLVITAIMTAAGIQIIGGQSIEKKIEQQSQKLIKQLNFMCEKAVFEHRPFAFEFSTEGHQLITHRKQQWMSVNDKKWPIQAMDTDLVWQLYLQGNVQPLSVEFSQKPHIICYSNGQLSSFELLIEAQDISTEHISYQLATISPIQLKSGWVDET